MSDLAISFDELGAAVNRMIQVRAIFDSAHGDAGVAAQHVGHGGLEGKVREFADEWDIKRSRIVAAIVLLSDHYQAVVQTMRDLDSGLGDQIRAAAADAAARADFLTPAVSGPVGSPPGSPPTSGRGLE